MRGDRAVTREALTAIARRWIELGWRKGDAEAVRALYARDFVDLSRPDGRIGTRDDNVAGIVELYAAFPDFTAEIEDLIIDAETGSVAIRWSASGTHLGAFMETAPSGRRIMFRGIETLRVRGELIIERAGEWDGIDILRQIGAS